MTAHVWIRMKPGSSYNRYPCPLLQMEIHPPSTLSGTRVRLIPAIIPSANHVAAVQRFTQNGNRQPLGLKPVIMMLKWREKFDNIRTYVGPLQALLSPRCSLGHSDAILKLRLQLWPYFPTLRLR